MTNGRRVQTASGAILLVDARLDGAPCADSDQLFDPRCWATRGRIEPVGGGRGSAWFLGHASEQWVLRHFRRGGFVGRHLSADRYVWAGESRVRSFAEYRLLGALYERGLPVPAPIAARYQRQGAFYRCDLITRRIEGGMPLSQALSVGPLSGDLWRAVGATVGRLHAAGADHADLNAHNILVDPRGTISVIDFDRSRLQDRGEGWRAGNLRRLRRSLVKVSARLSVDRFGEASWRSLLEGYAPEVTRQ